MQLFRSFRSSVAAAPRAPPRFFADAALLCRCCARDI